MTAIEIKNKVAEKLNINSKELKTSQKSLNGNTLYISVAKSDGTNSFGHFGYIKEQIKNVLGSALISLDACSICVNIDLV